MWADANVEAARPAARVAALPTGTHAYWMQEREGTQTQAYVLPQPEFPHMHGHETSAGTARVQASPLLADPTRVIPTIQTNDDGATRVPKRTYQAYVSEDTGTGEGAVLSSHRSSSPGIGSARPTIHAPGRTTRIVEGEDAHTVIAQSEQVVHMLYAVIKTRTPRCREVAWRPGGNFQQLTLEQFKDQVPLALCSEAKGFRLKLTGPRVDLFQTVERCSEVEFQHLKNRLGAAVNQGLSHAESPSNQCEPFSLLIEEWRDGSAEVEEPTRDAALKW
ncbi:hypothetical protein NQ176_g1919 [Zarea fungicola]|uniref:Uncharacterized protein n=1 Tax=Zarea fungicola TaxID=93591 RepID=A0ACC1NT72_9HYPO|nr:hypothetical protein NQ176_g1919 [Lecanicillium fungicola]